MTDKNLELVEKSIANISLAINKLEESLVQLNNKTEEISYALNELRNQYGIELEEHNYMLSRLDQTVELLKPKRPIQKLLIKLYNWFVKMFSFKN